MDIFYTYACTMYIHGYRTCAPNDINLLIIRTNTVDENAQNCIFNSLLLIFISVLLTIFFDIEYKHKNLHYTNGHNNKFPWLIYQLGDLSPRTKILSVENIYVHGKPCPPTRIRFKNS